MSYKYDETSKRYVLNTSYVSTPTHADMQVAPDSTKSAREPIVFRISSKSRMGSLEDNKPETPITQNGSAEAGQGVYKQPNEAGSSSNITVVNNLRQENGRVGFREEYASRAQTAVHQTYSGQNSAKDISLQQKEQATFKKGNAVQESETVGASGSLTSRNSVPYIQSFPMSTRQNNNVIKLSTTEPTRFTITSEPTGNRQQPAVKNQPVKISDISRLHEIQLQEYEKTKRQQEQKQRQRNEQMKAGNEKAQQQRKQKELLQAQRLVQMKKQEQARNQQDEYSVQVKRDQDKKDWVEHLRRQRQRNDREMMELEKQSYERQLSDRKDNEKRERQKREADRKEAQRRDQQRREQIRIDYERREQERKEQQRKDQEKRQLERKQKLRVQMQQQMKRDQERLHQEQILRQKQEQERRERQQERSRLSSSYVGPSTSRNSLYANSMNSSFNGSNNQTQQNYQSLTPSASTSQLLGNFGSTTPNHYNNGSQLNHHTQHQNNQSVVQPPNTQQNDTQVSNNLINQQQERLRKLQEQNSSLRDEVRKLSNDLTLMKAKTTSLESNSKHELESLRGTKKHTETRLKELQQMKRDIESHLHSRASLSTNDIVTTVEKLVSEGKQMADKIRHGSTELANLISELKVKEDELRAQKSLAKSMDESHLHLKGEFDKERKLYVDTCKQLEQAKAQLRRLKEELNRNDYQGLYESNQSSKLRLVELTRELEDTKFQLRRSKEDAANHNYQRAREEFEAERKKVVELTRQCEQLKTRNFELERNYQLLEAKLKNHPMGNNHSAPSSANVSRQSSFSNLHSVECPEEMDAAQVCKQLKLVEKQLEREKANTARLIRTTNDQNAEINTLTQTIAKYRGDLNSITFLQAIKEKEVTQTHKKLEVAEQKHEMRIAELTTTISSLESKLEGRQEEYKKQFRLLRKELEEARSNWCDRVLEGMPFDQALKELLKEIDSLKRKLANEQENSIMIKEKLWACQSDFNNLQSELELERRKNASEKRTQQASHELVVQELKNDIAKADRLVESLGNKIKHLSDENKGKDSFIVKTLMNKILAQQDRLDVEDFFLQFQQAVPVKDRKKKLEQQHQQIDELEQSNRILVRELARLRSST